MEREKGELSWLDKDDLSAQNRNHINTVKRRLGEKNDATKKLKNKVQDDEYTRINRHSEGRCWYCSEVNKITSSVFNACEDCINSRGNESIMSIVGIKFNHELCDFCGVWKQEVCSINTSLCDVKCCRRVARVHKLYKLAGGRHSAPIIKLAKRQYGKDYRHFLGKGFLPPGGG